MRPNVGEIMAGVNKTIMRSAIPIVQQSGETQALWELATSTRLMLYVENRWKNEFGRLAGENIAMEELLKEAAAALREAEHALASELDGICERSHCEVTDLPSIDTLHEQNADLKGGLDKFIIAHSAMADGRKPGLGEARQKIREYLKEVTLRDFEAAQEVIFL